MKSKIDDIIKGIAVTCAMPLFLCDFPPDPDCKKVL